MVRGGGGGGLQIIVGEAELGQKRCKGKGGGLNELRASS